MASPAPHLVLWEDWPQDVPLPRPSPVDVDKAPKRSVEYPWNSRLVRVGTDFIIKYGTSVVPEEGHNMMFVAKSTAIPVPKVFAIYQRPDDQDGTITYIVMEYIPGNTLQELWPGLDQTQKAAITTSLRTYFDELRQLKGPGYIGSNQGNPPRGDFFSCNSSSDIVTKTFRTEDEMVECLIDLYDQETEGKLAARVRYYRHVLADALRCGGPFVVTGKAFDAS